MTREEAITIIDNLHLIGSGRNQHENDLKINVALDMAIEALSVVTMQRGRPINASWVINEIHKNICDMCEQAIDIEDCNCCNIDKIKTIIMSAPTVIKKSNRTSIDVNQLNFGTPITTTESLADVSPMEWSEDMKNREE